MWQRDKEAVGLAHTTKHGLRKNASIELIEAGCSEEMARAITGHKSSQSLSIYAKEVRQKAMAKMAVKLWNVAPVEKVEL